MAGQQLRSEVQRTLAFGSIGASYAAVGAKTDHPTQILLVQNLTDAAVQFSFDGVNDHFPLAAGVSLVLDACSDRTDDVLGLFISAGTTMHVKEIDTPTTGAVYITPIYSR